MPRPESVVIGLAGIELTNASSSEPVRLAAFDGVQILVLLRHRH